MRVTASEHWGYVQHALLPLLILWYAYMLRQPIRNDRFHCFCLFYHSFMNYIDDPLLVSTIFGLEKLIDCLINVPRLFSLHKRNKSCPTLTPTAELLCRDDLQWWKLDHIQWILISEHWSHCAKHQLFKNSGHHSFCSLRENSSRCLKIFYIRQCN